MLKVCCVGANTSWHCVLRAITVGGWCPFVCSEHDACVYYPCTHELCMQCTTCVVIGVQHARITSTVRILCTLKAAHNLCVMRVGVQHVCMVV